jgi:hypothetical protein
MADEAPKIHVDDDWKTQAQKEKERLAEETKDVGEGGPMPQASFVELINLLTMQIVVGLGGLQGAGGQNVQPNFDLAKFYIDLLDVLAEKTKGNLSPEEERLVTAVLHEMRLRYVEAVSGGTPEAGAAPGAPGSGEPA